MNSMCNGIMNVYKEKGFTSHDVVARLRGICRMKKIGHTGTLDPEAVGVLPVCFGSGTKLCDMLTGWDKEYIAVMRLGIVTDTQDMTGKILSQCSAETVNALSEKTVRDNVMAFEGEYDQIPPMYSALKVNGRKLYELARAGREIERAPRRVRIEEIEVQSLNIPYVTMRIVCSKGTYIRTLCHDIGARLGCGAAMESLVRSRVGIFRIEDALKLSELERLQEEDKISDVIIPPDVIFAKDRAVTVNEHGLKPLQNGNCLTSGQLTEQTCFADDEQVRVYDSAGRFYGIYGYSGDEKILRPVKMFLSGN